MPRRRGPAAAVEPRERADVWVTHGCGKKWRGASRSHCGAKGCHLTFSSVSTFDAHRKNGVCLDPASVGLVLRTEPGFEYWTTETDEAKIMALREYRSRGVHDQPALF